MGVRPPDVEDFQEEPKTPPGITNEDDNEDDLFSDTGTTTTTTTTSVFNFRSILPVLPAKGVFEDFLGVDHWDAPNENKKYCGKCFEDVKKDLKKLAEAVDSFRIERDAARKENEVLKKEVDDLKKLLKEREEVERGDVKVNIRNGKEKVDVLVRKKCLENETDAFNSDKNTTQVNKFGILSFSINLRGDKPPHRPSDILIPETKTKKTIADLRREFFAKEFESEQKTFTANHFLELKPEEKKETFRSKLNIRVKPKKKIAELISKLTSRNSALKVIPDPTPIEMFQRFEKTKTVWVNELEEKSIS